MLRSRPEQLKQGVGGARCVRVLLSQALQTQTGPVALFRVRALFKLPGHHLCGAHTSAQAPVDELLWRPLQMRPV